MPNEHPSPDENHVIAERRAKLKALRATGPAYPNDFARTHFAADLAQQYGEREREALESESVAVKVAGRLMLRRTMGKISFGNLQDMSGNIQLFDSAPSPYSYWFACRRAALGRRPVKLFHDWLVEEVAEDAPAKSDSAA